MEQELNQFERRLLLKPCVFIDPSVILASGIEGFSLKEPCVRYISKANKGYRPFITKTMMGEIFKRLCKIDDINTAQSAFIFFKNLFSEREFRFIPHMNSSWATKYLKDNCSLIPLDDRLNLSHIYAAISHPKIKEKEQLNSNIHFATIDEKINQSDIVRFISMRLGIKIVNPQSLWLIFFYPLELIF